MQQFVVKFLKESQKLAGHQTIQKIENARLKKKKHRKRLSSKNQNARLQKIKISVFKKLKGASS